MHAHCRNHARLYTPWWLVLLCLPLALASASLSAPTPVAAQDAITITDLGTLGGRNSEALRVNNAGQVMGFAQTPDNWGRPVIWEADGSVTQLGSLGTVPGRPTDMNELGHVAGMGQHGPSMPWYGFYWSPETGMVDLSAWFDAVSIGVDLLINDLDQVLITTGEGLDRASYLWTPDGDVEPVEAAGVDFLNPLALNNLGHVAGGASFYVGVNEWGYPIYRQQAFRWSAAAGLTLLPSPDDGVEGNAYAQAINDMGHVIGTHAIGTWETGYTYTGLFWDTDGSVHEVVAPEGGQGAAASYLINNGGLVAGSYERPQVERTYGCFLWSLAEGAIDLGTLGGDSCGVAAINDLGQLVGTLSIAGEGVPFFWSPETGVLQMPTLGDTGIWRYLRVFDLNERGQAVGATGVPSDVPFDWRSHGVLWTVPVPTTTPEESIGDATELVEALLATTVLGEGEANALVAKLESAQAQLDRGKTQPALNVLGAFANQVEALVRSGRLSPEQAQPLLDAASEAIALIEDGP